MKPGLFFAAQRHRSAGRLVVIAVLIATNVGANAFDDAAVVFASGVSREMITLLYRAAEIDPLTKKENRVARDATLKRQRELDRWLADNGGEVTLDDTTPRSDRENYRAYRQLMAGRDFLALSYRRRLRFIRETQAYLNQFTEHFPASVAAVLSPGRDGTILRPLADPCHGLSGVTTRLLQPLRFRLRHFNRDGYHTTAAVYVADHHAILVNMNALLASPIVFWDTVEHEIWHHLLPPPGIRNLLENIWWEGFNEVVAELWAAHFAARIGSKRMRRAMSGTVQYPVQSALATLCFAGSPDATLAYMRGCLSRAAFADTLARHNLDQGRAAVRELRPRERLMRELSRVLRDASRIEEDDISRIEGLLAGWGWTEDDGGRISISRFLTDDQLSVEAFAEAYAAEPVFLMDIIRAKTLVELQSIAHALPLNTIAAGLDVTPLLKRNLKRILRYAADPSRTLGASAR